MKGLTLLQLKKAVHDRKYAINEIWSHFLDEIEKKNPTLNAFLSVSKTHNESLPIAIKDNFCTKQLPTTASSKLLAGYISPYESTVTKKLSNSNIEMIGKTNMDAWAHGSSTETSDFGPTKNPHDISRVPGGSSGGSAAAVAAGMAPAAIGSETAGSIRQPASWTGVIGFKPSYGRVSRYGLISMCSSTDCPGTLTLDIADIAYLLAIISGKDKFDATSSSQPVPNYLEFLETIHQYKIGVAKSYFSNLQTEVNDCISNTINILTKAGNSIKEINLIDPKYAISVYTILQRAEVSSNLARFDGIRYGKHRDHFSHEAKKRMILGGFVLSSGYIDAYYKKALTVKNMIEEDFEKVFSEVDFIISPTTPTTAMQLGESAKYPFFGELMDVLLEPASIAGICAISVPMGFDKNSLPIGIQIMAPKFAEAKLLNFAFQLEKLTNNFYGIPKSAL